MTTKTSPSRSLRVQSLIVERNGIGAKIMQENQFPSPLYGHPGARLDLAAGDRFIGRSPAYELLARDAARPCRGGPGACATRACRLPLQNSGPAVNSFFDRMAWRCEEAGQKET